MKTFGIIIITLVALVVGGYLLTSAGLESKPGYSNLNYLSELEDSSVISLRLGPKVITPLHWLAKPLDDNAKLDQLSQEQIALSLLDNLEGLQLKVYENITQLQQFIDVINTQKKTLQEQGWETLITANDEGEQVLIMTKTADSAIVGLTLSVLDQQQAVFVNLMGNINNQELETLAGAVQHTIAD